MIKINLVSTAFLILMLFLISCKSTVTISENYFNPSDWTGSSLVQTKYGQIEGSPAKFNTLVWKGIPYAKPPVGEFRWKAPREAVPWKGILKADHFGNSAPQILPFIFPIAVGSEDCLYLNIWRPNTKEKDLPVYVYIHGGGNTIGSADLENYYGFGLASAMNAVYVSINYRLGPFGWFNHPALQEGCSPEDASGNYGTLDIIKALRWVRENINSFGGTSNHVIVAGESAGAFNILSLLISPLAKGLFDGAVIESGRVITSSVSSANFYSSNTVAKLLEKDGKLKELSKMSASDIRNYLYSKSPADILSVQDKWLMGMLSVPYIFRDGTVIPLNGFKMLADGTYPNKVPIIIGSNKDEYKLFLALENKIPFESPLYTKTAELMSMTWKFTGVDLVTHLMSMSEDQPPIYVYRFDWGTLDENGKSVLPDNQGVRIGAAHSLEIPFFMNSGDPAISFIVGKFFTEQNKEGRLKLQSIMMKYLNGFVHTGNPNSSGLKEWPAWNNIPGSEKGIVFDAGYHDAKLSYLTDEVTFPSILSRAQNELNGEALSRVTNMINSWYNGYDNK